MFLRMCFLVMLAFAASASSYSSRARQHTYIVQMDTATVVSLDDALSGTRRWYEAVIDSIVETSNQETKEGVGNEEEEEEEEEVPELLYVYENAITGFAAKLSDKQVKALEHVHGLLSVHPDELLSIHTTHTPQFLGLNPGQGLWGAPNLASDIIIGIIDTGIWPEHASFNDTNMRNSGIPRRWNGTCEKGTAFSSSNCNKKLIGARAFYKGFEASTGPINETREYKSPRDANGHGTHTASTAAGNAVAGANLFGNANGTAMGMKYTARIAAYKACWYGRCIPTDIMAAIDSAVADGVDVLSLSIGGPDDEFYNDPIAIAAFRATQKGVFIAFSAGNDGPSSSTVENNAPWVMTVAASYLDRSFPTTIQLGDGRTFNGTSLYSGNPTGQVPIIYGARAGRKGAKYCDNGILSRGLVRGKIVVCQSDIAGAGVLKGEEVNRAQGSGLLLLNTREQGEEQIALADTLPASSVGVTASKAIRNYALTADDPTAEITFVGTAYGDPAPSIAALSSRGPNSISPDIIKPDISAPGMNILAAWPSNVSPTRLKSDNRRVSFNINSGTSMACPHVSGLAALLKSRHPNWSPAAIKSAIMTTAYTLNNRNASIADVSTGKPATAFDMGSGHINSERASDPGLVYDIGYEDYMNYLCSLNYTSSQVTVVAGKRYSCPVSRSLQAGDLNYPSFSLLLKEKTKNYLATYARTVTNVGSASCAYTVNVREPTGVSVSVEPMKLDFLKMGEKLSYKVTFVNLGGKGSSFGELVWVCGEYSVRSPIAATWQ